MKRLLKEIAAYSVKRESSDNPLVMEKHYCFDKDFIGFSGHFPGYPILPAVLQLLLAQLCIEEQKGCKISITSIEKAKFLSEIRPDELISIQCADADVGDSQRMKVKIMSKDKVLSTFNLYFHPVKEMDSV
jgi:3-hydroxyacyl-[acyl-carrier-protein] dehydratase